MGGFGVFAPAWEALNDDLNTPGALGGLFTGLRTAAEGDAAANWRAFHAMLGALGLVLPELVVEEVPDEIRALAERRQEARKARDWAAADAMRDELLAQGWVVKDGKGDYELERR